MGLSLIKAHICVAIAVLDIDNHVTDDIYARSDVYKRQALCFYIHDYYPTRTNIGTVTTTQTVKHVNLNTESLHHMYVRATDGGMSPLSRFVRLTKTNGPSDLTRFNLFNAISILSLIHI